MGYLDNLNDILKHDEVSRVMGAGKLDDAQLSVLNVVVAYEVNGGLPDGVSNMDVVKLSRHFKNYDVIGPGSTIGRTLDKFAAEVLEEPAAYCAYGEFLVNPSEKLPWFVKAVEVGDVKALCELAYCKMKSGNRQGAIEAFKIFLANARGSKQFNNSHADFEELDILDISLVQETLFKIYALHSDCFDAKEAKYYAAECIETNIEMSEEFGDFGSIQFPRDLKDFAVKLYHEGDNDGVELFLKDAKSINDYHEGAQHKVLAMTVSLDRTTNGTVTQMLLADESEQFDGIKRAYESYTGSPLSSELKPSQP